MSDITKGTADSDYFEESRISLKEFRFKPQLDLLKIESWFCDALHTC
jgi:hypothetical protein